MWSFSEIYIKNKFDVVILKRYARQIDCILLEVYSNERSGLAESNYPRKVWTAI